MGCGSGSVVSCGGRVSLAPWQEGSEGQQAAVGPVALAPCDVPGALAGDHGPTGLALVRCDAASWSCVSVRRLGRPNCALVGLFVNQVRRVPYLSLYLPLPPAAPPTSARAHSCCACRMPARLARPSAHFVTVGKAPSRGRVQLLYERKICMLLLLHACHHAHVRCRGSGGAAH